MVCICRKVGARLATCMQSIAIGIDIGTVIGIPHPCRKENKHEIVPQICSEENVKLNLQQKHSIGDSVAVCAAVQVL